MTALILLTRPRAASERFAQEVRQSLGPDCAEVMIAPLAEIAPCGTLPDMSTYRGVVFTSQNAVATYGEAGGRTDLPAYCVGDATARAAADLGMAAHSAQGDAQALVAMILQAPAQGPLLHLRGAQGRGRVAERLTAGGLICDEAILYEQRDVAISAEHKALLTEHRTQDGPIIAPVFSPLGAARLARIGDFMPTVWVLAISDAAVSGLGDFTPDRLMVADVPDRNAMLDGLKRLSDAAARLEGRRPAH